MEVNYEVLYETTLKLYDEVINEFNEFIISYNEEKWKKYLMVSLLDDHLELYGIEDTICYLIGLGLTRKQLQELRFNEKDIECVFRRLGKYETEL